jgi:hypothetical protein
MRIAIGAAKGREFTGAHPVRRTAESAPFRALYSARAHVVVNGARTLS